MGKTQQRRDELKEIEGRKEGTKEEKIQGRERVKRVSQGKKGGRKKRQ